jgi:hypothetical protein
VRPENIPGGVRAELARRAVAPVAAPVLGVRLLLRFGLVTGQAWRRTDRHYCYGCGLVVILLPGPSERCRPQLRSAPARGLTSGFGPGSSRSRQVIHSAASPNPATGSGRRRSGVCGQPPTFQLDRV